MVNAAMQLSGLVSGGFVGSRVSGVSLRHELEVRLDREGSVSVDFSGVEATQSFIDEFVGVLILEHGPAVLRRVSFLNCSENLKSIIGFVASRRARDYRLSASSTH